MNFPFSSIKLASSATNSRIERNMSGGRSQMVLIFFITAIDVWKRRRTRKLLRMIYILHGFCFRETNAVKKLYVTRVNRLYSTSRAETVDSVHLFAQDVDLIDQTHVDCVCGCDDVGGMSIFVNLVEEAVAAHGLWERSVDHSQDDRVQVGCNAHVVVVRACDLGETEHLSEPVGVDVLAASNEGADVLEPGDHTGFDCGSFLASGQGELK